VHLYVPIIIRIDNKTDDELALTSTNAALEVTFALRMSNSPTAK